MMEKFRVGMILMLMLILTTLYSKNATVLSVVRRIFAFQDESGFVVEHKISTSYSCTPGQERLNIMVMIGTRPEAIKLAPLILEFKRFPEKFRCVVVSTGQHKEMLDQVLNLFAINNQTDILLKLMTHDQGLAHLSAEVLKAVDRLISVVNPNLILVQGDTTTAYMSAMAAFYRNVPVAHVEAGLRTFNMHAPFPEEMNRQGISNIASFHFAATNVSASNLRVGAKQQRNTFVTGNTVVDALHRFLEVPQSDVVVSLLKTSQSLVVSDAVVCLFTAHRRESHGEILVNILRAVSALLSKHEDLVVIFPVHMNPQVRLAVRTAVPNATLFNMYNSTAMGSSGSRLILLEPLNYHDLVHLMNASYFVLTDSGGMQEEANSLGRPVLVLRNVTERVEGVAAGVTKVVGSDANAIIHGVSQLILDKELHSFMSRPLQLYGDGNASAKIVSIISQHFSELLFRNLSWEQHEL